MAETNPATNEPAGGEATTPVVDPNAAAPASNPQGAAERVTLTGEQYNAILDSLDELEDLKTGLSKQVNTPTVDSLAAEANTATPTPAKTDISQLEGDDLVAHIINEVNTNVAQPLLVKMEEIRLDAEIKDLTKDDKNADFWDLKEEIYQVASRNPNLSIKEAYNLAKTEKGLTTRPTDGDKTKPLRNLPDRRALPIGEKAGIPGSAVGDSTPETRKDAAEMAWDAMDKAGKI